MLAGWRQLDRLWPAVPFCLLTDVQQTDSLLPTLPRHRSFCGSCPHASFMCAKSGPSEPVLRCTKAPCFGAVLRGSRGALWRRGRGCMCVHTGRVRVAGPSHSPRPGTYPPRSSFIQLAMGNAGSSTSRYSSSRRVLIAPQLHQVVPLASQSNRTATLELAGSPKSGESR